MYVFCSMAEKVMPSAYCCFPLSILFLLSLVFICCCCLPSYGLSVAQRCSGAAVQRWELFCLVLIVARALVVVAVTPIIVVVVSVMFFVAVFLLQPEGNEQK